MNRIIQSTMLTIFLSCYGLKEDNAVNLTKYTDWKAYSSKILKEEMVEVCNNWPKEWGQCPDGNAELECISSIDIDSNIAVIRDLMEIYPLENRSDYKFVIIQLFMEGFNSWHCETFLTNIDNEWKGKKICKSSPNGDPFVIKTEKPTIKQLTLSESEIEGYLKSKSGTLSSNGIIAVTFIDEQYNILKFHMALYP